MILSEERLPCPDCRRPVRTEDGALAVHITPMRMIGRKLYYERCETSGAEVTLAGDQWELRKVPADDFLASQGIEPPEGENQPGWWVASFLGD